MCCDQFASDCLVPRREVILRKLTDRGLIDRSTYDEHAEKWSGQMVAKRNKRTGGDFYATRIAYLGKQYMELVLRRLYRNQISTDEAAQYLDVKPRQVRALVDRLVHAK